MRKHATDGHVLHQEVFHARLPQDPEPSEGQADAQSGRVVQTAPGKEQFGKVSQYLR